MTQPHLRDPTPAERSAMVHVAVALVVGLSLFSWVPWVTALGAGAAGLAVGRLSHTMHPGLWFWSCAVVGGLVGVILGARQVVDRVLREPEPAEHHQVDHHF